MLFDSHTHLNNDTITPEEREELQKKDQEELERINKEVQEQYDVGKVFEDRRNRSKVDNSVEMSTELTLYKEPGFMKRIFNFIKGLFK